MISNLKDLLYNLANTFLNQIKLNKQKVAKEIQYLLIKLCLSIQRSWFQTPFIQSNDSLYFSLPVEQKWPVNYVSNNNHNDM